MAKRKLTEEQRQAAAERLAEARAARGHDGSTNVADRLKDLDDDHPLHWKTVKEWIKYNKELLAENKKAIRRQDKGAIARGKSIEGYIRHMETYLRTGDWIDMFYGKDQEHKMKYRVIAPARDANGEIIRTIGYFYDDVGIWTEELQEMWYGTPNREY